MALAASPPVLCFVFPPIIDLAFGRNPVDFWPTAFMVLVSAESDHKDLYLDKYNPERHRDAYLDTNVLAKYTYPNVDDLWGMWLHRWGDHLVRTFGVALHLPDGQAARLALPYAHQDVCLFSEGAGGARAARADPGRALSAPRTVTRTHRRVSPSFLLSGSLAFSSTGARGYGIPAVASHGSCFGPSIYSIQPGLGQPGTWHVRASSRSPPFGAPPGCTAGSCRDDLLAAVPGTARVVRPWATGDHLTARSFHIGRFCRSPLAF
ncbi:unnamed protein product [Prorocentrum cordatum]|uniref:Uncharacterized protein n=1 Tax=Prorocentrum cordatum TaxID=2364126 RepID=A0ABN9RQV1_9DINO|nr:unnamed protein product [Polarella glacialis]